MCILNKFLYIIYENFNNTYNVYKFKLEKKRNTIIYLLCLHYKMNQNIK